MATAIASGLGATLGLAQETTVGTFATPTRWVQFEKESLAWKKNVVQSKALNGGLYLQGARRQIVTHTAAGAFSIDMMDRGLGLLFANMLGTFPTYTQIGTTGVYQGVFTPGDLTGHSLSVQVGRPMTNGTIQPFSYNGLKVTDWTIGVTNTSQATIDLSFDAFNSVLTQTYAAPSFVASNMLTFIGASLLVGGTATTTAGVTTITGATSLGYAKSASIKGTNALATDRYFLGSAGTKAEQLANDFRAITGTLDFEFADTTDVLTAFYADTPVSLQLDFQGPIVATSPATPTQTSGVQIVLPQIRWEGDEPQVGGPGVLEYSGGFTALSDGVDPAVQITYQTLDTVL